MPGKEVADLLAGFAPEVRNLALAARAFVLEMTPDISERVDVKARMIGYSYCQKYADMVGMIMPTKAGVNLGIAYAMSCRTLRNFLKGPANCIATRRVRPPRWQVLHAIRLPEIIKLNSHGSRT
jgi:hypothetical protein